MWPMAGATRPAWTALHVAVAAAAAPVEALGLAQDATVVALLPAPVAARAVSLTVESVDRIVIQLEAGRQLVWGSAEQSELKGQVAVALLTVEASLYDVSAPSHPATRA